MPTPYELGQNLDDGLPDLFIEDSAAALPELPDLPIEGVGVSVEDDGLPPLEIDTTQEEPSAADPSPEIQATFIDDSMGASFGRAANNLQASFGGFAQTVGQTTGGERLALWGKEFAARQQSEAAAYGQSSAPVFSEVNWDDPSEAAAFGKEVLANSLLSVGVVGGAAAAGALLAPAALTGAVIGTLVASVPMSIGEVQNMMEQVAPGEENPLAAIAGGSAVAALDVVQVGKILNPIIKRVGVDGVINSMTKQGIKESVAREAVKDILTVSAVGTAQSAITQGTAYGATSADVQADQFMTSLLDAAVMSGVGATPLVAGSHAYAKSYDKSLEPGTGDTFYEGAGKEKLPVMGVEESDPLPLIEVEEADSLVQEGKSEYGMVVKSPYGEDIFIPGGTPEQIAEIASLVDPKDMSPNIKDRPMTGSGQVLGTILRAVTNKHISFEEGRLAAWALLQNPTLATGLRLGIVDRPENVPEGVWGDYDPKQNKARVFWQDKELVNTPVTTTHEVLHHTEKLLPPEVREKVGKAWERAAITNLQSRTHKKPTHPAYLTRDEAYELISLVKAKEYNQFVSHERNSRLPVELDHPSEYWAHNGGRILSEAFKKGLDTKKGDWRGEALRYYKGAIGEYFSSIISGQKEDVSSVKEGMDHLMKSVFNLDDVSKGTTVTNQWSKRDIDQVFNMRKAVRDKSTSQILKLREDKKPDAVIGKFNPSKLVDIVQGRSTDALEPLAVYSPSFGKILDYLRRDRKTPGKVVTLPIRDRAAVMEATFKKTLNEILKKTNLSEEEFFDKYSRGIRDEEALNQFQDLMDLIHSTAKTAGLNVGYIKNMLPFTADKKKILAHKEEFIKSVAPYIEGDDPIEKINRYFDLLEKDVEGSSIPPVDRWFSGPGTVGEIADKHLSQKGEFRHRLVGAKRPMKVGHLEFNRMFPEVPQNVMNKWGVGKGPLGTSNIRDHLNDYFHQAARRIVFAHMFGPNGGKLNALILKGVKENQERGREVLKSEIEHLYNIVDAFNHQYGSTTGPQESGVLSAIKAGAITTSLNLSLLSSLVDPLNVASRVGLIKTMRGLTPAMRETSRAMASAIMRGVPETELSNTMSAAGLTMSTAAHNMAARAGEYSLGRAADKYVQTYFKLNPVTYWTQFTRNWSAAVGKSAIHDDLQIARFAPPTSRKGTAARLRLADVGIDPDHYWNTATPIERHNLEVDALRLFVSETALDPGFTDKPLWMSKHGWTSLLGVVKSYPVMFSNTILPQLFGRYVPGGMGTLYRMKSDGNFKHAMSGLFILGGYMFIGATQDALRQAAKQGTLDFEDDRTDEEYFLEVFDRTVEPMWMSYLTAIYRAKQFGTQPADSVAGPGVGLLNRVGNNSAALLRAMRADLTGESENSLRDGGDTLEALNKWLVDVTPAYQFRKWFEEE